MRMGWGGTGHPPCLPYAVSSLVCTLMLHLARAQVAALRTLQPAQELFSALTSDWLLRVALGLGETVHAPPPAEGEVGRKGISHERTFRSDRRPGWRAAPAARAWGAFRLLPRCRASSGADPRVPVRPCSPSCQGAEPAR